MASRIWYLGKIKIGTSIIINSREMAKLLRGERISYHEAGHAVAAFVLRMRFTHVCIIPDEDSMGHTMTTKLRDFQPDMARSRTGRDRYERYAMVSLAGLVAERLRAGRVRYMTNHPDVVQAFELCSNTCGSDEETRACINWLWERTRNLMKSGRHWAAVEALAEQLRVRRYIGERETRRIIKQAFSDWGKLARGKKKSPRSRLT
jgi:hypothetical protein